MTSSMMKRFSKRRSVFSIFFSIVFSITFESNFSPTHNENFAAQALKIIDGAGGDAGEMEELAQIQRDKEARTRGTFGGDLQIWIDSVLQNVREIKEERRRKEKLRSLAYHIRWKVRMMVWKKRYLPVLVLTLLSLWVAKAPWGLIVSALANSGKNDQDIVEGKFACFDKAGSSGLDLTAVSAIMVVYIVIQLALFLFNAFHCPACLPHGPPCLGYDVGSEEECPEYYDQEDPDRANCVGEDCANCAARGEFKPPSGRGREIPTWVSTAQSREMFFKLPYLFPLAKPTDKKRFRARDNFQYTISSCDRGFSSNTIKEVRALRTFDPWEHYPSCPLLHVAYEPKKYGCSLGFCHKVFGCKKLWKKIPLDLVVWVVLISVVYASTNLPSDNPTAFVRVGEESVSAAGRFFGIANVTAPDPETGANPAWLNSTETNHIEKVNRVLVNLAPYCSKTITDLKRWIWFSFGLWFLNTNLIYIPIAVAEVVLWLVTDGCLYSYRNWGRDNIGPTTLSSDNRHSISDERMEVSWGPCDCTWNPKERFCCCGPLGFWTQNRCDQCCNCCANDYKPKEGEYKTKKGHTRYNGGAYNGYIAAIEGLQIYREQRALSSGLQIESSPRPATRPRPSGTDSNAGRVVSAQPVAADGVEIALDGSGISAGDTVGDAETGNPGNTADAGEGRKKTDGARYTSSFGRIVDIMEA